MTLRVVDAVVVLPGVMGSELVDSATKDVLWGLNLPVLGRAWLTGNLSALQYRPDDETTGRVTATRLLRTPVWAPFLRGQFPYCRLLKRLRTIQGDPRAVDEFAYDWRPAITGQTSDFAGRALEHLAAWRRIVRDEKRGDPEAVRLVIVAHSMGGLIARHALLQDPELAGSCRRLITIATPFYGSLNALEMLAYGHDAPVPEVAARELGRSCPSVYDLLPRYACVDMAPGYRRLRDEDLAVVGGSLEMAREAQTRWQLLGLASEEPLPSPVQHIAIVGAGQPTSASASFFPHGIEVSRWHRGVEDLGDGTVWRRAASPKGLVALPVYQSHAAVAVTDQTLQILEYKLLDRDSGPPMGTRPIGVEFPIECVVGSPISVCVHDVEDAVGARPGDPSGIVVTSINLQGGPPTVWPAGRRRDGTVVVTNSDGLPRGLHRVEVSAGGFEPVTDLILVGERR